MGIGERPVCRHVFRNLTPTKNPERSYRIKPSYAEGIGIEISEETSSNMEMYQEGHGGVRTGAGRPRGARNKRPSFDAVKSLAAGEQSPLDFLLHVMRDEKQDIQLRLMAAKAAAPYMTVPLRA